MKKILLSLLAAILFFTCANATTYTVTVSDYQFSPSTVNAVVGDIIKWVYVNGFHTTTSRTIPAGAATWNAPMQSAGATYSYQLTTSGTYNYWCSIHTTEMEGTINVTGSLAVNFGTFSIAPISGSSALISWQTFTETNTAYYSVRRSYDGNNFSEIGKVNAAGNSLTTENYHYTDATFDRSDKYIYYEIAAINKDGSMQLSAIKLFQNTGGVTRLVTSLSPNPVTGGHLMLQFNADAPGEMQVEIFDAGGKAVLSTQMSAVQGINNGHLMMMDLVPGAYNIVFFLNGVKETHNILVQ